MSEDEQILEAVQQLSHDVADLESKLGRILNELEGLKRQIQQLKLRG